MGRCLCVNMSKKEYLEFGELPASSCCDSAACNTVAYFLGTEWANDIVVFAFEEMTPGGICPEEDETLFEHALRNFDERCILNSAPRFRYLVNLEKNIYYDKDNIPEGDDGSCFDPSSLLLSATAETETIGLALTETEKKEVGAWRGDRIVAVNNISIYPHMTCVVPPFRCKVRKIKGELAGLNIVVTGIFPRFDRMEVEAMIREAGGNPQTSVTKKTDYLVVADKPGRVKLEKARKYGIPELTPEEFLEMLE
ncbi:BRCT domain-containing protein [Ructibacterium gallinarum]|uniref:BRCT domain-containing protein n=1 Tax=Ructibacterium gallinarum TaxID=2779355 RepID=A0A9D5LYU9_9FIRM|nr:BRCT domain-containing protein [Ructibacterium gallinarum]MBE5040533.1 BRCT domain-containing protein [Ructibacterium gallinarum]